MIWFCFGLVFFFHERKKEESKIKSIDRYNKIGREKSRERDRHEGNQMKGKKSNETNETNESI